MTRRRRKATTKGKKSPAQASKDEAEDIATEEVDSQTESTESGMEGIADDDSPLEKGVNVSEISKEESVSPANVAEEDPLKTSDSQTEEPNQNQAVDDIGETDEISQHVSSEQRVVPDPQATSLESETELMDCDVNAEVESPAQNDQKTSNIDSSKPSTDESQSPSECIQSVGADNKKENKTNLKDTSEEEGEEGAEMVDTLVDDEKPDESETTTTEKTAESNSESVVAQIDLTESDEDQRMEVDGKPNMPAKSEPKVLYVPAYLGGDGEEDVTEDPEFDTEEEQAKLKESKDFLKYWNTVNENPQDFTAWTYLLQLVEQEGKLPLGRRSYNSFFKRYPLCYGYWKKFSEFERKHSNLERAQKILERGVRAIPLSIDLWVHVIDFYINHYKGPDAGKEKTRVIFNRAIKAAGEEFRSEKLWNKYIQWELANKDWSVVMNVYKRAIATLTQHYSIFFNDFKEFVNGHSPQDFMSPKDFQDLLSQVRSYLLSQSNKKTDAVSDSKKGDDDDGHEDAEERESAIDEAPPGVDDSEKPANEEEIKLMRAQIINDMKKVYEETEQAVTKIWAFEEGIKRPYFHVKQLERAQLKNWREYLDMEINRGEHHRVVLLFERCLIACALYEDFWLKYAKYMAKHDSDKARAVYERACTMHLPKKPNIHMQWAAHEELIGNAQAATDILERLDNSLPGMAMIKMRRVAVERRCGNIQKAEDLLKSYVACAAKDKEEVFYTRKLAWFLFKISGKKDEARKFMKELIPKYKSDVRLYNDLVEMEFQNAGGIHPATTENEVLAMEAFDIAIHSDKLSEDQQLSFSRRKVEFLEDYGADIKRLQKAYDEHQKLIRNQKKRAQSDSAEATATPTAKKAKTDSTSITVVGSATTAMANGTRYTTGTAASVTNYLTTAAVQQQPALPMPLLQTLACTTSRVTGTIRNRTTRLLLRRRPPPRNTITASSGASTMLASSSSTSER